MLVAFIFIVLLSLSVPIAFVVGISALSWLIFESPFPIVIFVQRFLAGINNWTLLAIPMFVFAGVLMEHSGITKRLISCINSLVGHIKGGLALCNILISMIFSGVSGTAVGDTSSVGGILIPAMKKEGYKADYAAAVTAASSVVGPIIPPSLPMIIAAMLLNLSVGKLFIAGIIPGILLGLGMMAVAGYYAKKENHPVRLKETWANRIKYMRDAVFALLMPLIIIGGIIGGFFTPTEASGIACIYAILVGFFIYKELKLDKIVEYMISSLYIAVPIMFLVGAASMFSWMVIVERIPQNITYILLSITDNTFLLLLIINVLLLFVGTFMETNAAILILFPVLFKMAPILGINEIQFTVMMILNLMIGLTTPPLGVCLFVAAGIANTPMGAIVRRVIPFLLVNILVLLIVAYVPQVTVFLPDLFYSQ